MLGFNGGLLGKRREPTVGAASGLWFPNEQSVAERAGIWPVSPLEDPYFQNVSLLLHMDGSNGSTTITDSSSSALTVTANGNAQISTAQSKFGGASGVFDGNGDFVSFDPSVTVGASQDVTLECWFYRRAGESLIGTNWLGLNFQLLTVLQGRLFAYWNGPEVEGGTVADNTWNHAAITRSSGTLRLFLNGTQVASASGSTANFVINQVGKVIYRQDFDGYIDDVRITVGVARYTSNFTPPTAPFPSA
jgi:hypothetical protein